MVESTSSAQVLDLICEGEIGGLVAGAKSIFLNEVPAMNDAGQMNFEGFEYVAANGTNTQSATSGFDEVRNEIAVGVEASITSGPIVRTISNTNITAFLLTVQMPALYYSADNGDQVGTDISYAVEYRPSGGAWTTAITESFNGKAITAYERQYRVQLTGPAPWSIRLRRITPDATDLRTQNKTYFKSYTEVIDAKMRYPNSAVIGTRFDSKAFNAIPRRAFDVKLLKIKIPSNATVRADGSLTYSGSWDGTFQTAWSANPAWCFYDLLTNERYGLGKFLPASQIDKWGLYQIGQYCDELVPNGFGGTEPRFTCNIWINNRREAFQVLNDFTSIFRGMAYWGAGSLTAVQDAPKVSSYLFTNANVVDGRFTYQGASSKARHTVALVTWNDLSDMGRAKVEYVEDTAGIDRYGIIETEVVAIGCTSRGQAHRVGKWLLYSEQAETEVVMFKTGAEGALVRPGDVITVADQHRAGARMGGRISAATSTTVTVDRLASAPAAGSVLYAIAADGTVQQRAIASASGNTVTVTSAFSTIPAVQSAWIISTASIAAQTFRVLTVAETDLGEHEISALEHDPTKYAQVEQGIVLADNTYSELNLAPDNIATVYLTESVSIVNLAVRPKVAVGWVAPSRAARFKVEWSKDNGNFVADFTGSTNYDIMDTSPGVYVVRVTPYNAFGTPAQTYTETTLTAVGTAAAPAAVTNLTATPAAGGVSLSWSGSGAGLWQTEVYENTTTSSATATLIATVSADHFTRTGLTTADGDRYYWVKLVSTSGVRSGFSNEAHATALNTTGPAGTAALTGYLTNEAVALFSYADGNVASYAPATGAFKVFSGNADVSSNFTLSTQANPQALTVSYTGQTYSVTGGMDISEDTATLTIRATGSGAYYGVTIDKVFALAKAKAGYEPVDTIPTSNLFTGRVVYLKSGAGGYTGKKLYYYNGSGWVAKSGSASSLAVIGDTVDAGSITSAQLSTGELITLSAQIKDATVDTLQIAGYAVTVPGSSYGSTQSVSGSGGSVQTKTLNSLVMNFSGASNSNAVIFAYVRHTLTSSGGNCPVTVQIQRDGVSLRGFSFNVPNSTVSTENFTTIFAINAPAAGNHTYSVVAYYSGTSNTGTYTGVATADIFYQEAKR